MLCLFGRADIPSTSESLAHQVKAGRNMAMCGSDIIFAPIVSKGQTEKEIYIPDGEWILTKDKSVFTKDTYKLNAEIDEFIALVRSDADVLKCFE